MWHAEQKTRISTGVLPDGDESKQSRQGLQIVLAKARTIDTSGGEVSVANGRQVEAHIMHEQHLSWFKTGALILYAEITERCIHD